MPYFLPLLPRTIFSGGRHRAQMIVALPGYVFFRGDDEQRRVAVGTGRLGSPIEVPPHHQARFDDELAAIERATIWAATLDQDREDEIAPHGERIEGTTVKITDDPLAGCTATLLGEGSSSGGEAGGAEVVLPLTLTGHGVRIRIAAGAVEPTGK